MEMREGLRQSSIYLANLIEDEIRLLYRDVKNEDGTGIDLRIDQQREKGQVMPVGFSQGSTMGTMLLLSGELECLGAMYHFGGFVGLNGWLGFRRQIEELNRIQPL
jgi:predicted esterase